MNSLQLQLQARNRRGNSRQVQTRTDVSCGWFTRSHNDVEQNVLSPPI